MTNHHVDCICVATTHLNKGDLFCCCCTLHKAGSFFCGKSMCAVLAFVACELLWLYARFLFFFGNGFWFTNFLKLRIKFFTGIFLGDRIWSFGSSLHILVAIHIAHLFSPDTLWAIYALSGGKFFPVRIVLNEFR